MQCIEFITGFISEFLGKHPWWSAFFAEFFAGLTILVLATFIIPWYLDRRKRPKLLIEEINRVGNAIPLCKSSDGNWEGTLHLAVRNLTKNTVGDRYWHIFIPKELQPTTANEIKRPNTEISNFFAKDWVHFSGFDRLPLYPSRRNKLPFEIKIKSESSEKQSYKIYYFFSTEQGTYPVKAKNADSILERGEWFSPEGYFEKIILDPDLR